MRESRKQYSDGTEVLRRLIAWVRRGLLWILETSMSWLIFERIAWLLWYRARQEDSNDA